MFIDPENGAMLEYDGPYVLRRDGSCWDTDISINLDERGRVAVETADSLIERIDEPVIAYTDTSGEASKSSID